jgi:hypothetical protein
MVLDWSLWRETRLSDQGRSGLAKRPLPVRSWGALWTSDTAQVTWPYTHEEIDAVRKLLPARNREAAVSHAVRAAQRYVFVQTRGKRSTANPRKEIEELRAALLKLFNALMHLSPEAHQYLAGKMTNARLDDEQPFTAESLRHAIDRFDTENRRGLEQLPDPIRGGARPRMHEKRLDQRLEEAFIIGHGGKRLKHGFPAFQDACLVALKDFGLLPRSSKALKDANRKRGKNLPKNR